MCDERDYSTDDAVVSKVLDAAVETVADDVVRVRDRLEVGRSAELERIVDVDKGGPSWSGGGSRSGGGSQSGGVYWSGGVSWSGGDELTRTSIVVVW